MYVSNNILLSSSFAHSNNNNLIISGQYISKFPINSFVRNFELLLVILFHFKSIRLGWNTKLEKIIFLEYSKTNNKVFKEKS